VFRYVDTSSIMDSFDALSKLLWLVCIGILSFTQPPTANLVLYLLIIVIALLLGRISLRRLCPALAMTLILGFFFLLGALYYPEGTLIIAWGPLRLTQEGISQRSIYAFRVMNVMLGSMVFVSTTNPRELVSGLIRLGLPYRLAFTIFVGLNYVPTMAAEIGYVRDAQRIRGLRRDKSLGGLVKMYLTYLLAVLLRALRKAQITAYALDSKGFGAYHDRTYLNQFQWSSGGLLFAGMWVVVTIVSIYLGFVQKLW